MLRFFAAVLLLCLIALTPARAYTPESGMWWNASEPGVGYTFDLQDNYLAVTMYAYAANGEPEWYLAAGFLQGNALFEGTMMRFEDGMCFGCAWRPYRFDRNVGSVRVVFNANDPTRATMTLAGRTFPITRYQFYMRRPEDGTTPIQLTKMLGEWSTTIDLSSVTSASGYPYSGEVLVFDLYDTSEAPGFFDGCRPDNSEDGFCSNHALNYHGAGGYYDSQSGRHIIVVDDSANYFVRYVVQVGTDHLRGSMAIYPKGTQPQRYYPARGFRSASRTFVEDGVGPAQQVKRQATEKAQDGGLGALLDWAKLDSPSDANAHRPDIDPDRLQSIAQALEHRLMQQRATD